MRSAGLKGTMSGSEWKLLMFMSMLSLLVGLAVLGEHLRTDWVAPIGIMLGLFGICLGVVKQRK